MSSIISWLMDFIADLNTWFSEGLIEQAVNWDMASAILQSQSIRTIYNAILPVGLSLCCLFFLLELYEQTTHDNLTPEHLIRGLVKLFLGVFLLDNLVTVSESGAASGLLLGIANFASGLCTSLSSAWDGASIQIIADFTGSGLFSTIGKLLTVLTDKALPYLIIYAAVWFTSITRNLTVTLMAICSPIAVADVFHRGLDSNGIQYVKRFLGVCLQTFIIGAVCVAIDVINLAVDVGFIKNLLFGFAAASIVFKSKNLAYEVVGAR